ncbi:MAG: S41 family peptidase [Undibacterium sp.]|nr:S41 family peptidase [Undibacterium sp.]
MKKFSLLSAVLLPLILSGCGGGGSDAVSIIPAATTLPASNTVANLCQAPRAGNDPFNDNKPYPDRLGTLAQEKTWLRSWTDETYLWYREVPTTLNPANYATAIDYFDVLKTSATTASGKAKDQFHFTYPSAEWDALSQQGIEFGYGITWSRAPGDSLPRKRVVAMLEPGSPADKAGLHRGDQLITVDGADYLNGNDSASIDKLNAGLFPEKEGETHTLIFKRDNSTVSVFIAAANVVSTPVQNTKIIDTPTGKVGYLTFNNHNSVSELQLINSIDTLKAAGVTDLVLDLRYNGGGLLYVASELAYMIAGPVATNGKTFEQSQFNDKIKPDAPTPFFSTAYGFSAPAGQPLPYLGLKKVSILTSAGTCSASEAIINSLQGIDVEVSLIGAQTCGKPYGFYPTPNCGTTYFSIQFKGINNKGFGDYADGIPATCNIADDFTHALGDPLEAQLAAALHYRNTKICPAASSGVILRGEFASTKLQLVRPLAKEIAIYSRVK